MTASNSVLTPMLIEQGRRLGRDVAMIANAQAMEDERDDACAAGDDGTLGANAYGEAPA